MREFEKNISLNVIPRYDMEKVAKRESYERFWGYNKIKKENKK